MLETGDRVVVAVSGGPDSVCLLGVLRDLAAELGIALHAAHLDHMFRGEESAAEARFVASLCRDIGVPATVEARDVPAYCAGRGLSAQAGAREVRYGFLREVARRSGAQRIALGHTAGDQAETVLMRLIRGAGPAGLAGIPPVRDDIIRPLIEATRPEILAYLVDRKLGYVNDPSNLSPVYTRNRVRRELIPALERFNPRIVETLAAEAALLREENEAAAAQLEPVIGLVLRQDGDRMRIGRTAFNALPAAVRRRILRFALASFAGPGRELSSVQTEESVRFMESAQSGRSLHLPGGLVLSREYDDLVIGPGERDRGFLFPLSVPGVTRVPALGLSVEVRVSGEGASRDRRDENNEWQAQFDYAKIALPLALRSRRRGDRFHPAGMGGRAKKLQDYFVDEKVPRPMRDRVPLLASGDDIVWVVGMRTNERFLAGPGTERVLAVSVTSER